MSFLPAPLAVRPTAPLARTTPVTRIIAGGSWLVAAVLTGDAVVEARLCGLAIIALITVSGLPIRPLPRRLVPVLVAAFGLGLAVTIGSAANTDATQPLVAALGPVRITSPALGAGLGLGLRLVAIALTSVLVFGPSDTTRLADSLVQQWRLPERFSYGTVAALGLAPILAADWTGIGAARRLRGLEPRWLPGRLAESGRRLLTLLVVALRRAERLALAMDARGFDSGTPRSRYRTVRVGWLDVLVVGVSIALAAGAFALGS